MSGLELSCLYDIPLGRFKVLQHLDVSHNKKGFCLDAHSVKLLAGSLTSLAMRHIKAMTTEGLSSISLLRKLEELDIEGTDLANGWKKALVGLPLKKLTLNEKEDRLYTGAALTEFLAQ